MVSVTTEEIGKHVIAEEKLARKHIRVEAL